MNRSLGLAALAALCLGWGLSARADDVNSNTTYPIKNKEAKRGHKRETSVKDGSLRDAIDGNAGHNGNTQPDGRSQQDKPGAEVTDQTAKKPAGANTQPDAKAPQDMRAAGQGSAKP